MGGVISHGPASQVAQQSDRMRQQTKQSWCVASAAMCQQHHTISSPNPSEATQSSSARLCRLMAHHDSGKESVEVPGCMQVLLFFILVVAVYTVIIQHRFHLPVRIQTPTSAAPPGPRRMPAPGRQLTSALSSACLSMPGLKRLVNQRHASTTSGEIRPAALGDRMLGAPPSLTKSTGAPRWQLSGRRCADPYLCSRIACLRHRHSPRSPAIADR